MPGRRVLVPLGARSATGIVLGGAQEEPGHKLREVSRLLDDGPLLTPEVVELCRWASAHYLSSLGLALKAALPPGIEIRERLVATLTTAGTALLAEPAEAPQAQGTFALPAGGPSESLQGVRSSGAKLSGAKLSGARLSAAARTRALLRRIEGGRQLEPAKLQALARQGLVSLAREEQRARVATPVVELASASPEAAQRLPEVARAPRQRELLEYLLARQGSVPVEELLAAFPVCAQRTVGELRHGHIQHHVPLRTRHRDHKRVISNSCIDSAPRRHIGHGVGPTHAYHSRISRLPSVGAAAHPVICIAQRDAANAMLARQRECAPHCRMRVQVPRTAPPIPSFHRAEAHLAFAPLASLDAAINAVERACLVQRV